MSLQWLSTTDLFTLLYDIAESTKGFILAQKMVGKACGLPGIRPNTYCEPKMTTVGSQDTTGPMTRDELKDLAYLGFTSDFIMNRGGVSLRPDDGIIHSWLNRMLLPDKVGTGGDSHTRFPIGISLPASSSLVAFSSATGMMPLGIPESVLVRFKGKIQPGITT